MAQLPESPPCQTRLLADLPADRDAFGPHLRIAETIADLLAQEPGGKAIALEGSWGSGKSTLVSLLKELLAQGATKPPLNSSASEPPSVFVFDAWAHQGDPLRRSFLEQLLDFLSAHSWINGAQWMPTRDALARRVKIQETQETPQLTHGGLLLALTALFVPVGVGLLSAAERVPLWILLLAGTAGLLPLIAALYIWLAPSRRAASTPVEHGGQNVLSLLVSRSVVKTRSETHETPDPTSVEFQEIFRRILDNALGRFPDRRLLVVMDNLDRVDPTDALAIWSTMRAFFEGPNLSPSSWAAQFWLLVPFDPAALTRLWPGKHVSESSGASGNESDLRGRATLIDSFIDKTFQIRFRVPAPVLTDSKNFLLSQLNIAFPDHLPTDDFELVHLFHHRVNTTSSRPTTPRDIKLFINSLSVLHRQWGHTISLPTQALYLLSAPLIRDAEHDLIRPDLLDTRLLDLLANQRWQTEFAALHFGVPPDKALQVLLRPPVDRALVKGDPSSLSEYASVPGFWDICALVVEENWTTWAEREPAAIALAAGTIRSLELAAATTNPRLWWWLRKSLLRTGAWRALDRPQSEGLVAILRSCTPVELQPHSEALLKALSAPESSPSLDFHAPASD